MTTLTVKPLGAGGVEFGPSVPFPSMDVYRAWREILPAVLSYAFLNRPAWVITVQPQKSSLGRELTAEPEVVVDGIPYLSVFRKSCSAELLADIAESEDFNRGLLWLTSLDEQNEAEVFNLIRLVQSSDSLTNTPQFKNELLTCDNDGEAIYWLNPHKPISDVLDKLAELTQSVGWTLDVSAFKSSH